jgi:hypothetical protein
MTFSSAHVARTSFAHAAVAAPAAHTPGVPAVTGHSNSRPRQQKIGAARETAGDAFALNHRLHEINGFSVADANLQRTHNQGA